MSGKSGRNTVKNSVAKKTNRGRNGGRLKVGNTGNRGGGRTPDEFKKRMAALSTSAKVEEYLQKCLNGEFGPKFFLSALAHATDRGYGKAAQPLEHSGANGEPIEVKVTYEIVDPT